MTEPERKPTSRSLPALAILLGILMAVLLIETGGQIYATFHPSYWGLFLKPHAVLGWTLVPGLRWRSTGTFWYQREFDVPITVSSRGYRDLERTLQKPQGTLRVALLGDSLIEAIQVPLEQTAGQVLERKLSAWLKQASGDASRRFEVLNFGVSNYGIGQFLLTWEDVARAYEPDYVVILASALHMNRTVNPWSSRVSVRPTFRIENGEVIRVPPKEIAKMLALQERAIRDMLGGERIRRSGRRLFIGSLVQQLSGGWEAPQGQHDPEIRLPTDIREQNLRLIDELHRSTRAGNARLGVADLFTYLNSAFEAESVLLQEFCSRRGIGHIPASNALLASIDAGISPRWRYDAHFNELGNEILAESIYRWITSMEAGAQISRRTNGKADRTMRLSTAKAPNAIQ